MEKTTEDIITAVRKARELLKEEPYTQKYPRVLQAYKVLDEILDHKE